QFQMEECHLLLIDQVDLVNLEGHQVVPDVSKPLPLRGPLGQTHSPSDRSTVRSHMRILSVVSLKTYERYGYTFLKEIVLCRADYKEYKISEADFKNMHPNDFEDLYLLHLQGQLNHLSGADKFHLFNAFNLWIRNIVIRKRVEDLQLKIESYQTKLNLTQPDWDASDFLFKEDNTIVSKPRALNHMVKDFKLFKYIRAWKHEFGLRTIEGGVRILWRWSREESRLGEFLGVSKALLVDG
ncbi:hypothetical protein Tco_1097067, partial [Tanacetum coccineum]